MIINVVFSVSVLLSLIFKDSTENIFIVIASISIYKIFISEKNYRKLISIFLFSYLLINIFVVFGLRIYFYKDDIDPVVQKEETLILLVYEGEDKSYNIREKSTQIYLEQGYKSMYNSILSLNKHKHYYQKIGQSNYSQDIFEISENLKNTLDQKYIVANACLYSQPYFENTINVALKEGYEKILICPVFMTDGKNYENLNKRYEKMDLLSKNYTEIEILEPMDNVDKIIDLYVDNLTDEIINLDIDSGIVLVGLDENDKRTDIKIRKKIKEKLETYNLDIYIKLSYGIKETIKSSEKLLEYGINSLYILTPTSTIDNIYTRYIAQKTKDSIDLGYSEFYHYTPKEKNKTISSIIKNMIEDRNS